MKCLASALGFSLCRASWPPLQNPNFFQRLLTKFFCWCRNPHKLMYQRKRLWEKENARLLRQQQKQKRRQQLLAVVKIQSAWRQYKLRRDEQRLISLTVLGDIIRPIVMRYISIKRAKLELVKLREEKQTKFRSLGVFSTYVKAKYIGDQVRARLQREHHEISIKITPFQAQCRGVVTRRRLLKQIRDRVIYMRSVLPFSASPLFRGFPFKTTAREDIADQVVFMPPEFKLFLKNEHVTYAKGWHQLSRKTFERNYTSLQVLRGVYTPFIHLVNHVTGYHLVSGVYTLHFDDIGIITPKPFTGDWTGEILVFVTNRQQQMITPQPRIHKSTIIPPGSIPQAPIIPLNLLMEIEGQDRLLDKRQGLNVKARSFSPQNMAFTSGSTDVFVPRQVKNKNKKTKKKTKEIIYGSYPFDKGIYL